MEKFGFENFSKQNIKPQGIDKNAEFEKLLSEANDGVLPEEYTVEGKIEFEEGKSGLAENIISEAQEMLRKDLSQMLSEGEKVKMDEIVNKISDIKRRSATDLWLSEVNRLMQNGGDVDNFKKLATSNLYKEMKKEVEAQLGINESSN